MSTSSSTTIALDQPGYFDRQAIDDRVIPFFNENGFLVVTGTLSPEEIDELIDETAAICRGERGDFTQGKVTPDSVKSLSDEEVISQFLCIHQTHKCSPLMHRYLAHPVIVDVLTRVIGPNVKAMQSMLFIKASGKPGQAWHQDEDYIPTRDRSLCGAWIAMDDATLDNGCLWIIPGSNKPGILWPQFPHNDPRFDCAMESYNFPYRDEDAVPVEVPRGSIVFFNGYTLHRSLPNRAPAGRFRRVLVNHYMSAESFLPWHAKEKVAVAKSDYRDIVMIAGKDPHAWKGTEDIARPHVRAAGDGGCGDGRTDLKTFKEQNRPDKAHL